MNIEQKANIKRTPIKDVALWSVVCLLMMTAIACNYYYRTLALPLRLIGWLFVLVFVALVSFQTNLGKNIGKFAQDARLELRKVVWRSRQETLRLSLTVAVIVAVTSLLLWGMDGVLLWLIGWLTGQRG